MVFMHQEKKKGYELKSCRIRSLLGRDMRIIAIPYNVTTKLHVTPKVIELENNEEIFKVNKQSGLFDEGIIITGDGI